MMVIPFKYDHIKRLRNFGGQEQRVVEVSEADAASLESAGEAFSAIDGERIIGCAGVIKLHSYRATAWGLFQRSTHADFLFVHKSVMAFLRDTNYSRIEAYVDPGFYPAMRWIAMLGFKLERAYIPFFYANGTGASAWALHK